MGFNKIKIYALFCTQTKQVFYVGATHRNLNDRLKSHISDSKHAVNKSHKQRIIYDLLLLNKVPEIFLLEYSTLDKATQNEQFYIDLFRYYGFNINQGKSYYSKIYNSRKYNNNI